LIDFQSFMIEPTFVRHGHEVLLLILILLMIVVFIFIGSNQH
jgi:hypothetical protein